MNRVLQDMRIGLRSLFKTPSFAVLTVLILGLAIGVNTAIFSMVDVLMFRDLPIKDEENLAFIYTLNPSRGTQRTYLSRADFIDVREQARSFESLAAANRSGSFIVSGIDEPVRVQAFEITANTFDVWHVRPLLGRSFAAGEDAPGADRVVMLSHGFWERSFAADPDVVGKEIKLDGYPTTIIGVVDPEMEFGSLAIADVWAPLRLTDTETDRDSHALWTMGRLAPGVTHEQAHQEVTAIWQRLQQQFPETHGGWSARVFEMKDVLADNESWMLFYLLFLTVTIVLAIACSNVATMTLARSSARAKEIAVRAALGAGRGRIVSQLLIESLMLSLAAGALGVVLAHWFLRALTWMADGAQINNFFSALEIDGTVLWFAVGVSFAAPLIFGLLPSLRAARPDLVDTLREGSRGNSAAAGLRTRRLLVSAQVALALALMIVAGLLITAIVEMADTEIGFDPTGLLTARLELPEGRYPETERAEEFFDRLLERTLQVPGVQGAALFAWRPGVEPGPQVSFRIEGKPEAAPDEIPWAMVNVVSPGALQLIGLPLRQGREFTPEDGAGDMPVVIINSDAAERFWPGEDPLGQRVRLIGTGYLEDGATVVGVFRAMQTGNPQQPTIPSIWMPLRQQPRRSLGLVARVEGAAASVVTALRREVTSLDPDQPVADARTMERIFDDFLAGPRSLLSIFVAFAAFALLMAAAGIYGVVSFSVAQRTQEIGIRMALGSTVGGVAGLVVRQAIWMVLGGLLAGSLAGWVLSRLVAASMPGTSLLDPLTLAAVAATLLSAAAIAALIPARRATRVDPLVALRSE